VRAFWLVLAGCGRIGFSATADAPVPFAHVKTITIPHGSVTGGPHASFPLLIELAADADLAASARPDGFDIAFTQGATSLAYEREHFDPATGALVAWVSVPSLPPDADTTIELHYGDPDAADQQAPASVWASYSGVWHLGDALADSTSNRNDATAMNGLALGAAGVIGGGLHYDGVDDYLDMANSASLDATATAATLSAWVTWDNPAAGHYQFVMSSSNRFVAPGTRDGYEWAVQPDGHYYFYPWGGTETTFDYANDPFTAGVWHHAVVTMDLATSDVVLYVDGAPVPLLQDVHNLWTTAADPADWLWGGNPLFGGNPAYFAGSMDELRVATTVRSPGWIATEYANQRTPATFYTVGPER